MFVCLFPFCSLFFSKGSLTQIPTDWNYNTTNVNTTDKTQKNLLIFNMYYIMFLVCFFNITLCLTKTSFRRFLHWKCAVEFASLTYGIHRRIIMHDRMFLKQNVMRIHFFLIKKMLDGWKWTILFVIWIPHK